MKNEIKWVLYLIGLGMALVAYGHSQFATKSEMVDVKTKVETMDARIYEIWKAVVK